MAGKVDHKRELSCYSATRNTPQVVEVPDLRYLMIDGHGDPNTAAWTAAVSALYPVAYRLRFTSKNDLGRDHVVMPLEGLWWADDMDAFTTARDKTRWDWTLMIMIPDWITHDMFAAAVDRVAMKDRPQRLADLRLGTLSEGRCVQALHVGSYDDEGDLLRHMHQEFIPAQNLTAVGRHHEIYLSDPRRVEPARLRTILRQPVSAGCGGARPAGACDAAPVHLATRVLDAEPRCGRTRLVCVDGRSGSGKTTFGGRLAAALGGAPVLHMDEICPGWDGLAASVSLLHTGVVASLLAGREATCRRWDWVRSAPAETVSLGRPPLLVVEGVGSGARVIAAHAVLLVWMDAPREVRYRRGIARDGDSYRPHWERWAAQEDLHFAAERTRDRADLHLDGRG